MDTTEGAAANVVVSVTMLMSVAVVVLYKTIDVVDKMVGSVTAAEDA